MLYPGSDSLKRSYGTLKLEGTTSAKNSSLYCRGNKAIIIWALLWGQPWKHLESSNGFTRLLFSLHTGRIQSQWRLRVTQWFTPGHTTGGWQTQGTGIFLGTPLWSLFLLSEHHLVEDGSSLMEWSILCIPLFRFMLWPDYLGDKCLFYCNVSSRDFGKGTS